MQQDFETLSLRQAMGILRRRALWIAVCLVLFAAAAYGFSKHQTKKYTATASLVFENNVLSQQIVGLPASGTSPASLLAERESQLERVTRGDMAAKTAARLGHGLSEEKVANNLRIGALGESGVVTVSATSRSPALAAAIANTYTRYAAEEQQAANHRYFKTALSLVRRQLDALPPKDRVGADGVQLQNRAQTLSLLVQLHYGDVHVAQEAVVPAAPTSPMTRRNTLIGALIGLLIGLGLVFLLEHFDRRVSSAQDLRRIYDRPILGSVPRVRGLSRTVVRLKGALPPVAVAEAFNLIRAHMRLLNVNRDLRTIAIVSPAPGDGKSTVASEIARAAARSGARVLLVETDLRRPELAGRCGTRPGPGLSDVLSVGTPLGDAVQPLSLVESPGRSLDLLAAGESLPVNPGALLESPTMEALLDRARLDYDLVVVDTPPLSAVSDGFPLLKMVDGVIVVARVGYSRREPAEQLQQLLAGSGTHVLGLIAIGATQAGQTRYLPAAPVGPSTVGVSTNGSVHAEDLVSTTSNL